MTGMQKIKNLLTEIYGEEKGRTALGRLLPIIEKYTGQPGKKEEFFSQQDVVLITYGDTLQGQGQAPLATLREFAGNYLKDAISTIHFLPFFPYSSDDGFSVMDFFQIDPQLGSWEHVNDIGRDFQLMFDYVVNHFSSKSQWFDHYLSGQEGFEDFAIEVDPAIDLSGVTRPRSLPLLSEYQKKSGQRVHLWTTFSADQIDFNFASLNVLAAMTEVLLYYVKQGATILRQDAIAYLWKEIGTPCIHLPQTHAVVKLFRAILDLAAPDVMIITETNVPHAENISYFGNGRDEAQMVYNFTLPPLLFYAFVKEDTRVLTEWAKGLYLESSDTTFFNFTASHDGIGVRPLEGVLPARALDDLIGVVKANGGQVSYKRNPDGTDSPYELNITYVDAILAGKDTARAERFLASQAIQYVLPGVPATYIHSLLGSRNWTEGVKQTGRARTVNREKLQADAVINELKDPQSFRARVFYPYIEMIKTRIEQPAFHPNAEFEVLNMGPQVFAIRRSAQGQTIYALTNVSSSQARITIPIKDAFEILTDLISGRSYKSNELRLAPYQYLWLITVTE